MCADDNGSWLNTLLVIVVDCIAEESELSWFDINMDISHVNMFIRSCSQLFYCTLSSFTLLLPDPIKVVER